MNPLRGYFDGCNGSGVGFVDVGNGLIGRVVVFGGFRGRDRQMERKGEYIICQDAYRFHHDLLMGSKTLGSREVRLCKGEEEPER